MNSPYFFVVKRSVVLIALPMLLNSLSLYAQTPTAESKKIVPLVELTGTAYERGVQHGRQLQQQIAGVFAKWKTNIRSAVKGDLDSLLAVFLKATDFEPAIQKHTPAVLAEVKGIAAGSGQPYQDVFAFQLLDEFWIYLDRQYNMKNHHCSGLGVPAVKGRPAYIAQNVDLEGYMNGYQVLFHIPSTKSEPEQYILSCAGLVAISGMNAKGIGVCVNTLMELQASSDGLPVAFMIRALLSKQKGSEVLSFVQSVKHASGQNYILGIVDSVYDFEASANQVVRYIPQKSQGQVVYHTNHALANHDVKEWYKDYHQRVLAGQTAQMNSEVRFAALENYMATAVATISPDLIKTTLRSKDNDRNPVCRVFRTNSSGFTFSSVVYTLGGKRSMQLTNGSPDQSDYVEYFFQSN